YKVAEGSYGNLTLYPKFVKNYQIIFDEALGEEVDNMIFLDTDTYAALPTCVRMGYTFNGWKTGSKIFAQGQTSVSEIKSYIPVGGYSITLIAQWQVITYNITYKSSDGTAVLGSDTYTVEQSKTLSTQWGVAGWSESIGGNTITVIPLGSANRDMILYAKFN
ncbi:MAG: hypothetical protein EOM87_05045, partial [Clostridia bacterium]|nr:hypothetical protein [Clostridia bacterium]